MLLYESTNRPWDAAELLQGITRNDIRLGEEELEGYRDILWDDLCSEYDAENLCLELERRARIGAIYTPELWSFEKVWRRDEFNHYVGFRRIFAIFYAMDEAHIDRLMTERTADFSAFEDYLTDEFKLCLMLAYDELATTRAYAEDVDFYRALGPTQFHTWIERVRADEAIHYKNALRVCQTRWHDRLPEAPPLIESMLAMDLGEGTYQATFLMDHKGPSYSPQLLKAVAQTMLTVISRS